MRKTTIDRLIADYRVAASAQHEPNDGTPTWRNRVNDSAERMLLISREVASRGDAAVHAFAELLNDREGQVSLSAAHHLLDFMQPAEAARRRALEIIEQASKESRVDASAEQAWLENWSAEQQNE